MIANRISTIVLISVLGYLMFVGSAMGFNLFSKPDVPLMTKEDLKTRLSAPNQTIIDLRKAKGTDGRGLTILGSVREKATDVEKWTDKYDKGQTLILVCGCKEDKLSIVIGQKLMQKGFKKVFALKGGWKEWLQAGFPTELK